MADHVAFCSLSFARRAGLCRSRRLSQGFCTGESILFKKPTDSVGGLSPDTKPVLDAITLEDNLLVLLAVDRIVNAQFLDHVAVAVLAMIHRRKAIVRLVPSAESLEFNTNGHVSLRVENFVNPVGSHREPERDRNPAFNGLM